MALNFPPPPTFADPVVVDPVTKTAKFNPLWLNWFLQFTQLLQDTANANTGDQTSIVGITGSVAEFNDALTDANFATGGGTATGTNTGDQTSIVGISGTKAEFDAALVDGNFTFGGGTSTGTNTGDQTISIAGDVEAPGSQGVLASTVKKINGIDLATLGTGILKNTTGTGAPSIAVAGDFPTLNQSTTGSAATLATPRTIDGQAFDGSTDITVIAPATHTAPSKATPVDADELPLVDSEAANILARLTWANLKVATKAFFDTIYATGPAAAVADNIATYNGVTGKLLKDSGKALPAGAIVGTTDIQTLTNKTADKLTLNAAGSTTVPQLDLAGATNNWIRSAAVGVAAPAFTTRSLGTKYVLYPTLSGSALDYAIGVESGYTWFSNNATSAGWRFYAGSTTPSVTISGTGVITCTGLTSNGTSGIGYAIGSGGTITQATSKATNVALNFPNGEIITNNAALAAGATISFTLSNVRIVASDMIDIHHVAGGTIGAYKVWGICTANAATIYIKNETAGSLGEALTLRWRITKTVTS